MLFAEEHAVLFVGITCGWWFHVRRCRTVLNALQASFLDRHEHEGEEVSTPCRCHMRTFICIIMHQVDFRCCIVIDAHSHASACARSFVMELNTLSQGLLMDSILHHLCLSYRVSLPCRHT